jgi:predicted amidohydrolase YtcJ
MDRQYRIHKHLFLLITCILMLSLLLPGCGGGAVVDEGEKGEVITQEEETTSELGEEEATVTTPDIIFFNGQVLTMETNMPQVEALAIAGEDILKLGSDDNILALSGPDTQLIDLEGKTLLTGFIDAHTHLFQAYLNDGRTLEDAQEFALQSGITNIGHVSVNEELLGNLLVFEQEGNLRIRTSVYLTAYDACGESLGDWYKSYPPTHNPSKMLRVVGVKLYSDGGTCNRQAFSLNLPEWWVIDDPQGDLYFSAEKLAEILREIQDAGYQAAIHSSGDRAVETVLDAFEILLNGKSNVYRHRIDHNTFLRPDIISRYSEINPIAVIYCAGPMASWLLDDPANPMKEMIESYPDTYPSWILPWRSFLDANPELIVAYHSDWPWVGQGPIPDLFSLVTRKKLMDDGVTIWEPPVWYAAEAINVQEALEIMTIGSAYALFMEEKTGSLKLGKFADLVILSENPMTIDPDEIINIQVLLTMVGGKVEYSAPGHEILHPTLP